MGRLTIDTGTLGNTATGDSLRGAFTKVNANFEEIYNELGSSAAY
jgi:chromosome segregation ATPase